MHEPIRSQLEDILQGRLRPEKCALVDAHLSACENCAVELREMRLYSGVMKALRMTDVPEPAAGFYARVLQRVEAQGRPSFWNLLLDPVFGQRLVYATGAMFLLMASFLLATTGGQPELARTPVQMMAQPAVTPVAMRAEFGDDMQRNREQFLATMASFSE
ncbi:MAG: anti-sigma factor family protein [Bryobacteraceae bacterium]